MKNLKALWIIVAFACATLALIALAGQAVTARPASHELKPPFNFVQQPPASRPEVSSVPPGSTVLMTETFGAAFTATTSLTGTTPLWRVTVNADDVAGYYWGRVGVSGAVTFTNSAWSAARLFTATQVLTPGVSTYPAGQDTWLIYGPFDLSRYAYAHLSFEAYLDSKADDTLVWAMSPDGQNFYGNSQSGPLGEWITNTYSFRANPSYQAVYLAFAFNSHTNPQGKGAFIRNVRLTGEPVKYTYLSLVANNYAAPTPTPIPPLFGYTFDPGNTTDLAHWGGVITVPGRPSMDNVYRVNAPFTIPLQPGSRPTVCACSQTACTVLSLHRPMTLRPTTMISMLTCRHGKSIHAMRVVSCTVARLTIWATGMALSSMPVAALLGPIRRSLPTTKHTIDSISTTSIR